MGKVKASRLPEPRLIEIPSLGDHRLMRDISIQLQDAGAVDHLDGGTGRELTPRIFHGSTGFPRVISRSVPVRFGRPVPSVSAISPPIQSVGWCCRWVSNLRPLPYQGSALPLSYGSVRRDDRSKARPEGNTRGPGGWQGRRVEGRAAPALLWAG